MAATAAVDRLRLGDHVCWGFDDDGARLDAVARFVAAGVREAGLRFAGGAAAGAMVAASRAVPAGLRLTGCRPELARLLVLVGGRHATQMLGES